MLRFGHPVHQQGPYFKRRTFGESRHPLVPTVPPCFNHQGPERLGAAVFAGTFLSSLVHFIVYFASGTALLVRGSGGGLEPQAITLVLPIVPWVASECIALATQDSYSASALHVFLREGWARLALGAAFVSANVVGGVLFFGVSSDAIGAPKILGVRSLGRRNLVCAFWF